MKRFIIEAAKAIAFLAAVAGLLYAANAAHQLIVGILVIAFGFLWAAIRVIYPRLVEVITRIRNYPSLLKRAANREAELVSMRERLGNLEGALATRHEQSVVEGNMQVIGALLAQAAKAPPDLVTISIDGTGAVILIGRYTKESRIRVGARFEVQVIGTGERKGVVQVTRIDADGGYVHMKCIERTAEPFWNFLESRAAGDPSPPDGVKLTAADFELPEDLLAFEDVPALAKGEPDDEH